MEKPDLIIYHATAADLSELRQIITPPGRKAQSIDLRAAEAHSAAQIWQRTKNYPTAVKTGSGWMLYNETTQSIDNSPRFKALLNETLFELIEFLHGKNRHVLTICFSTQILATVCNALLNLLESGMDIDEITEITHLEQVLEEKGWERLFNNGHPMRISKKSEFGVLPNRIEKPNHPLLKGIEGEYLTLIHMNQQVIEWERMEKIAQKLKDFLEIQLLLSRQIHVREQPHKMQILTGIQIRRALERQNPETPSELLIGFQGHPEWGRAKRTFARKLREIHRERQDGLSHYAETREIAENSLQEIEAKDNHGGQIMDNFFEHQKA